MVWIWDARSLPRMTLSMAAATLPAENILTPIAFTPEKSWVTLSLGSSSHYELVAY